MGTSAKLRDVRNRHDRFYKQAKREHFVARSAFKLEQLDTRFRLFKPGQTVLDLGCAPGSWLQYALTKIGPTGRLVGIDRHTPPIAFPENVHVIVSDLRDVSRDQIRTAGEKGFDVVLSDMAPDTTGVAFTDHTRSIELFDLALALAVQLGRPGSSFVAKIFMGEGFAEAIARVKALYQKSKTVRPDATRKESKELYVVAEGLKIPSRTI